MTAYLELADYLLIAQRVPGLGAEAIARFGSQANRHDWQPRLGYTGGMKTAISVPDELYARVERFARHSRRSRSEVYSAALREYVARHAPEEVTATLDQVMAQIGDSAADGFTDAAARSTLENTEW